MRYSSWAWTHLTPNDDRLHFPKSLISLPAFLDVELGDDFLKFLSLIAGLGFLGIQLHEVQTEISIPFLSQRCWETEKHFIVKKRHSVEIFK